MTDENGSGIYGLGHVGLLVPDVDEAIGYYGRVFGLEVLKDFVSKHTGHRLVHLGVGEFFLELIEAKPAMIAGYVPPDVEVHSDGRLPHFALLVHDIHKTVADLENKGVEVVRNVRKGTGTVHLAYVRDQYGYIIELFEKG